MPAVRLALAASASAVQIAGPELRDSGEHTGPSGVFAGESKLECPFQALPVSVSSED